MDNIKFTDTLKAMQAGDGIKGDNFGDFISMLKIVKTELLANWEGDTTDINDIIERIEKILAVFKSKIGPAVSQLGLGTSKFATAVNKISSGVIGAVSGAVDAVGTMATGTMDFLFGGKESSAQGAVSEITNGAGRVVETAVDAAAGMVDNLLGGKESSVQGVGSAVTNGVGRVVDGVKNTANGVAAQPAETNTGGISGFVKEHVQDIADNWDYSNLKSPADAIGRTVNGVVSTAGDLAETAVDGVSGLFKTGTNVVGDTLGLIPGSTGDSLEGITDLGGEMYNEVGQLTGNAISGVADVAGSVVDWLL